MSHFFYMGGYAIYVWSAYVSVLAFILVNAGLALRKWRRYLKYVASLKQIDLHE